MLIVQMCICLLKMNKVVMYDILSKVKILEILVNTD